MQLDGRGRDGRGDGRGGDLFSNVDLRFQGTKMQMQAPPPQPQQQPLLQQPQMQQMQMQQMQTQHQQMLTMAGANLLPPHQLRAIFAQQQAAAT